jgi:hypothetical protein
MHSNIASDIKRPFLVKAIKAIGHLLEKFGREIVELDEQKLLQAAKKKTGLSDFGDADFKEGLQVLLKALKEEANLNPMGKVVAHDMIMNLLVGRLLIINNIKQQPAILNQEIKKPLVIAGLPRTGTTILMNLLCEDPDARFLYTWEAMQICPPKGKDKRIATTTRQMNMLHKFVPGFQAIHATGPMLPQECLALMAFNFVSVQFELNFNIPSYQAWYAQQDLTATMQFHKKCLQVLQYYNPKQHWVLKTPPYVGAMEPLLAVYPDACIIQTHRDPAKVMASVSSLYYALLALGCDDITPKQVGAVQLENWAQRLRVGMQSRQKLSDKPEQFIDIYFEELLDNPVNCVKKIYQHFGMNWTPALNARLDAYMLQNGREKHGKHSYTPAMFGFDEKALDEKFADYRDYFNIAKSSR